MSIVKNYVKYFTPHILIWGITFSLYLYDAESWIGNPYSDYYKDQDPNWAYIITIYLVGGLFFLNAGYKPKDFGFNIKDYWEWREWSLDQDRSIYYDENGNQRTPSKSERFRLTLITLAHRVPDYCLKLLFNIMMASYIVSPIICSIFFYHDFPELIYEPYRYN